MDAQAASSTRLANPYGSVVVVELKLLSECTHVRPHLQDNDRNHYHVDYLSEIFSNEDAFAKAQREGQRNAQNNNEPQGESAATRAKQRAQAKSIAREARRRSEDEERTATQGRKQGPHRSAGLRSTEIVIFSKPKAAKTEARKGVGGAARCEVCLIQKKGRCGTATACRKCLKRPENAWNREDIYTDSSDVTVSL